MSDTPQMPEAPGSEKAISEMPGAVVDAPKGNWVDRFAPGPSRPYLRLSRADRPIGTWLLFIPCLWALALAGGAGGFKTWDLWLAVSCGLGAFLMRGAGCTWNDITDRDIDAQVARTRSRPLPSGQVNVRQALVWMTAQAALAAMILLSYNGLAIGLGVASLALVVIYPFAKRFTWWPQVFLGLAFNWGALLAWAAHAKEVPAAAVALYLAGIAWTLFYDTIYAHQDREDDALVGIRSTARKFADRSRPFLAACYGATIALLALSGWLAGLSWPFLPALLLPAALLARQITALDINDPAHCLRLFKANREVGLAIALAFLAGRL